MTIYFDKPLTGTAAFASVFKPRAPGFLLTAFHAAIIAILLATPLAAVAQTTDDFASPSDPTPVCLGGFPTPQCYASVFVNTENFATGGVAKEAVAKDVIPNHNPIHLAKNANDGSYGNGSSWISYSANSWLKIDLGQVIDVDSIRFGRDRTGHYSDRQPGGITIALAVEDNVYANGDSTNDINEYTQVFTESGTTITSGQTLKATFSPFRARFIKVSFPNNGTAIDEIEVSGTLVDDDGDGFPASSDCDDNDSAINPDAVEIPGNYVDENCDGDLGACSPCNDWKNHGQFVRCIAHEAQYLPEDLADGLVTSAAQTEIGKKGFVAEQCQP